MDSTRVAQLDETLQAVVVARRPLTYAAGADESNDRPAHVRAASSLAWVGDELALIQDDANFVALVRPEPLEVRSLALPRGKDGLRQFDDARGNKKYKLDLEACASIARENGPLLMALGSGSKKRRRKILMVDQWTRDEPRVVLADANSLYERLEAEHRFAGSDMNIEGVLMVNGVLRLFGRGNGEARGDLLPLNATCDLVLDEVLAYLNGDGRDDPPAPHNVAQYDLGAIDGVSIGFTDATLLGDHTLYSGSAEASKDSTQDGVVSGSVLGVITADGQVRYTSLTGADGRPFREKVEGVLLSRASAHQAYLVIDPDDATRPAELCTVELSGTWSA